MTRWDALAYLLERTHTERRIGQVRRVCVVEEEIPFLTAARQRHGHAMGREEEEQTILRRGRPPHHTAQDTLDLALGRLGIP